MKLQRNNKYTKMIASVLLTSAILSGCSNAEALVEPVETATIEEPVETTIVEDTEVHDIDRDAQYYMNYYKITDQERENRLRKIDIKYPDSVHIGRNVKTLIVKDNGIYKVLPVIELWDTKNKVSTFYDLFTEEKLFEYPYKNPSEITAQVQYDGNYIGGYDFKKVKNAIPYFDDKEIVEFGVCFYAQTFLDRYINEFRERDGINYSLNTDDIIEYYYDMPFNSDNIMINVFDYADNYVTTVPLENQVTSKELGLKSTFRVEDKYSNYWKISNEEIENILSDFEIVGEDMTRSANIIQSLVIKDSEGNYKLMNVLMLDNDANGLEFIDVYSEMHLFNAKVKGQVTYDNEKTRYTGIDLKNISDAIPYFDDKEIVKVDDFFGCVLFVGTNYEYFIKKDGINYTPLEDSYYYYMYPHFGDDEPVKLNEIIETKKEFAKYYIRSLPEDLRITTKDLKLGLEQDKEKIKTLN